MAFISAFSPRRKQVIPQNNQSKPISRLDFRGLDLSSPYDVVKDNRSPFARNFRIYADEADSRKVAVSSRKGAGRYTSSVGETVDQQNTSTTGAADKSVGVLTEWKAMKFTAGATGPLTKVELRLKKTDSSSGPIVVRIYSDSSGRPGTLLGESGILNSDITTSYTYVPARFIEAPAVTSTSVYWIVAFIQDDGANTYSWSSNTSTTLALTSDSSGSSWSTTTYSLNFKTYVSSTSVMKGGVRFAPNTGNNVSMFPVGTAMYTADDGTGTLTSLFTGLSSSATNYYFTYADGRVFWVNGFDNLETWDGSSVSTNSNLAVNGTFESNVTGWASTASPASTISRTTTAGEFRTGVAGMKVVGGVGAPARSTYTITLTKGKWYTLTLYVKGTAGQTVYPRAQSVDGPGFVMSGGFDLLTYTFMATSDASTTYGVESATNAATIYVDDVELHETGRKTITHAQLPVLGLATFHKNKFFGVSAADPNKLIWSEDPGNGDSASPEKFWYEAYLSTSFIYVPTSKASDPITAIVSFQDTLHIFTRTGKYVLYGSDPGSFVLRQATGKKGAVSQNAVFADENYIYFVAEDGFYRYNGSKDENISELVQTEVEDIGDLNDVFITKWKRQIRFYYPSSGSSVNDRCLIWHTIFEEWLLDTDAYVSHAIPWTDGDDPNNLVEVSSTAPRAYYAEQDYNNLGKAIDFQYFCKYDSMGIPAMRKRLTRFFPIVQGDGNSYPVQVGVDKDLEDDTRYIDYDVRVGGALIGEFDIGDGTLIEKVTQFKPARQRISGYGYYWQVRVKRNAINNRIRFIGYVLSIRTKRL